MLVTPFGRLAAKLHPCTSILENSALRGLLVVGLTGMLALPVAIGAEDAAGESATEQPSVDSAEPPVRNSEEAVVRDGEKVQFQFREHAWDAALTWLANESGVSIDWQSLPEDRLNLVTQRAYSLPEARDLFNMHLLARGYTLLQRGEILSVVKLEEINPTLVPRCEPGELGDLPRHDFIRTSFPLKWMLAAQAVKEFEPFLSPHGKISPMAATNRIEVMDAVVNVREIGKLLEREQSGDGTKNLVVEFTLQHVRARDVAGMLFQLLGAADSRRMRSYDRLRMQNEDAKLKAELVKKLGNEAKDFFGEEPVHIVANEEKNSILVNAKADKIELVRQAIQTIDQPQDDEVQLWQNVNRMRVYRMHGVELDAVRDILEELQYDKKLAQETEIELDDQNDVLIVYAPSEDHIAIEAIIKKFQPDSRSPHVVTLANLDPVYARNAIRRLLPHLEQQAREDDEGGRFRLELDEDHGRMLLWASETEMTQINSLLAQLGEPIGDETAAATRYIPAPQGDLDRLLKQIKRQAADAFGSAVEVVEPPATDLHAGRNRLGDQAADRPRSAARFAVNSTIGEAAEKVLVEPTGDGRLKITGDDPAEVERIADLVQRLAPGATDYFVLTLEHVSPIMMQYQLEEVFEHLGQWSYDDDDDGDSLSSSKSLRFVADTASRTLLVLHADSEQIERIESLVKLYDKPERQDEDWNREVRIYEVQHNSAEHVAEILKNVYRDLLSENDSAFESEKNDERSRRLGYSGYAYSRSKTPQYQGLLSVGVDDAANSLIISAPNFLIEEVMEVVGKIDASADKQTVRIRKIGPGVSPGSLGVALGTILDAEFRGTDERRRRRSRRGDDD